MHQRLWHVTSAVLAEVTLGVRQIFSNNFAHAGNLVEEPEGRKWESEGACGIAALTARLRASSLLLSNDCKNCSASIRPAKFPRW
jgi:hypothetical protein